MKELRNITDLEHELEIINIRREVELDKLKRGIRRAKGSLISPLLAFSIRTLFRKRKRK